MIPPGTCLFCTAYDHFVTGVDCLAICADGITIEIIVVANDALTVEFNLSGKTAHLEPLRA